MEKRFAPVAFPRDSLGVDQRRSRALILALPVLTVLWVGVVWFVAQSHGPRLSARLWIPAFPPDELLVRSLVVTFPHGAEPKTNLPLELRVFRPGGSVLRLKGQSDVQGRIDWALPLPESSPVGAVQLWHAGEEELLLAEGTLDRREQTPPLAVVHQPTQVALRPSGLPVELALGRGALSVPLVDELTVQWSAEADSEAITLELSGAEAEGGQWPLSVRRSQPIVVRPTEHVVEVTLRDSSAHGEVSRGFAILPVVPGAIGALRDGETSVRIISPVPRSEAFVVFASRQHALALERVELTPVEAAGGVTFEGRTTLSPRVLSALTDEEVWAVTSSEWDMLSEAQTGWPLNPKPHAATTTRLRWRTQVTGADGLRERLSASRHFWREVAWAGITLACLLELVLVARYSGRERSRLSVEGVTLTSARVPWLALTCIVLGFGGLAGLFAFW